MDITQEPQELDEEEQRKRKKKILVILFLCFLSGWLIGSFLGLFDGGLVVTPAPEKPGKTTNTNTAIIKSTTVPTGAVEGVQIQKEVPLAGSNNNTGTANNGSGNSNNGGNNNAAPTATVRPTTTVRPSRTPTPTVSANPNPTNTTSPTSTPIVTPTMPVLNPTNPFLGWRIMGLKPHLSAVNVTANWSDSLTRQGQVGVKHAGLQRLNTGRKIADYNVNFAGNLNWSNIDADTIGNKAFFHFPGGYNYIPGKLGNSYTLYVYKGIGNRVGICPGADSLSEVNRKCDDVYYLDATASNVDIVFIEGVEFWKISGLTGTGAFSLINNRDLMTRLQVDTLSDHTVEFTTTYTIDSSGDTITVDFVPDQPTNTGLLDFDFNGIDVSDIDLEDDGVDLTLCTGSNPCSAAAGVWGVNINSTDDIITFTAPTDAAVDEVEAGSIMAVKIGIVATNQATGNTQLQNPESIGSYETSIRLDNGSQQDFGELEVPIIDDDTANVTGYIDTFITFDIDTSEIDEQCDAAGGANPCDSHGGVSDNNGYVVDLGQMTTSSVNDSGDTVLHADGISGEINSIFFDLSTNATAGAVVTVMSLNEALLGPGGSLIPDVGTGEVQITAGSGLYGINSFAGLVNTATGGNAVIDEDCDGDTGATYYCDVSDGGSPIPIFTTGSVPIDNLRLEWEVGASPDAGDGTGSYSDELTFIASATF